MIKLRVAAAAAMLAVTGAAVGGSLSATVGLVSDYDFRGITQTLNDPAFQLGLTYTGESGVYYGLWGSNVDFQNGDDTSPPRPRGDLDRPSTEIDTFLGFSGEKVVGYDVGVIYYSYPNMGDINYPEVYAGISKGPASAKIWYSWAFGGTGGPREIYGEGNLNIPMGDTGFSLLGHIGYTDCNAFLKGHYYDWSGGMGYAVSNMNLTLKYVDGSNLTVSPTTPKNLGRFIFGVSTTLPWGK